MTPGASDRVLVAGVGNIFYGDDAFGGEVVRELAGAGLPERVVVADFGIRALHLAYEISGGAYDRVVLVDTIDRDAPPGTVEVFEPSADDRADPVPDAHSASPGEVMRLVQLLGGPVPPIVVVGCVPESLEPGMGLTEPVRSAIEPAIRAVLASVQDGGALDVPGHTGTDSRARRGRPASRRRRGVKGAANHQRRPARR